MHQTGESESSIPFRCLTYPAQTARRLFRVLGPGRGRLLRIPFGLGPSLPRLGGCLRRVLRYYALVRLLHGSPDGIAANGLPHRTRRYITDGRHGGLPVPAPRVSTHARVSRLRRADSRHCDDAAADSAFPIGQHGRLPVGNFRSSMAGLRFPLSTLRRTPHGV